MNNLDRIFLKSIIIFSVWLQLIKYPICFHIYEASNWECRCLFYCLLEKTGLDICCYIEFCSEQGTLLFQCYVKHSKGYCCHYIEFFRLTLQSQRYHQDSKILYSGNRNSLHELYLCQKKESSFPYIRLMY